MIGRLPILKEERDIGLQRGLIAFDGEVVVGLAAHDIRGQLALREKRIGSDVLTLNVDRVEQLALREKRIGSDVLTLNVDRVEQRDEHSDLIGLLGFFLAFYGQSTDFFWV